MISYSLYIYKIAKESYFFLEQATYVTKLVRQLQSAQQKSADEAQISARKLSIKQQVFHKFKFFKEVYIRQNCLQESSYHTNQY